MARKSLGEDRANAKFTTWNTSYSTRSVLLS